MRANGTSLVAKTGAAWTSWAEGPAVNLYDSMVRCIGHAKFSLNVPEQVPECGGKGNFTVTSLQC